MICAYLGELIQSAFSVIQILDPRLSSGVARAQGILERLKPWVQPQNTGTILRVIIVPGLGLGRGRRGGGRLGDRGIGGGADGLGLCLNEGVLDGCRDAFGRFGRHS